MNEMEKMSSKLKPTKYKCLLRDHNDIYLFFFSDTLSLDSKVVVTSQSVDEILLCDHSNITSSAVLSQGALYRSTQRQFSENIYSEGDLRSVVEFSEHLL